MKQSGKKTKAYTLAEILVILATIILLLTIVIPSIKQAQVKARDARRIKDLKTIDAALRLYAQTHNGNFPVCNNGEVVGNATGTLIKALVPRYLIAPPEDPLPSSYTYYYKTAPATSADKTITIKGAFFKVAACLEKEKDIASRDGGTASKYYEIFSGPRGDVINLTNEMLDKEMPQGFCPQ